MKIQLTHDMETVAAIISHPEIYPFCSDDGSPPASEFTALETEAFFHLLVTEDNVIMGVFSVQQLNAIMFEIHTSLLPCCRGRNARWAAELVIEWLFSNTRCLKLVSWVPNVTAPAARLAASVGMVREGICTASFLKNGQLCDMVLFGLSKRVDVCR